MRMVSRKRAFRPSRVRPELVEHGLERGIVGNVILLPELLHGGIDLLGGDLELELGGALEYAELVGRLLHQVGVSLIGEGLSNFRGALVGALADVCGGEDMVVDSHDDSFHELTLCGERGRAPQQDHEQ